MGLSKGPACFFLGNVGVKCVASLHPHFLICEMWERLTPPPPAAPGERAKADNAHELSARHTAPRGQAANGADSAGAGV